MISVKHWTANLRGSHVQIGVDVARKYRESAAVINCIGAHHGDEEFQSVEGCISSGC